MRYWLNLFSPRTWEDFRANGSGVSGFSENNWTRAKRIQFGDVFLCYLIGAKRWIGALRVVGDRYLDEDHKIFRDGLYPVRFQVEPIVALDPECGVPIEKLRGRLSFFPAEGDYKDWSGHVRSSPTLFAEEDGAAIRIALEEAEKEPVRIPIDPKVTAVTTRKKTKKQRTTQPIRLRTGSKKPAL